MPNIITVSPSSINLFRECPKCFWLKQKQGISRTSGPMSTLPSGMDYTLKNYYDEWRKKGKLPPMLEGKLPGKLLPDQAQIALLRSKRLHYVDQTLGIKLEGMLDDALMLENNAIIPIDNKTRGFPPVKTHEAHIFQMSAYTYLLRKNNYPTQNTAYLILWYLDHKHMNMDDPLAFNVAIGEVHTDPQKVQQALQDIRQAMDDQMPPPAITCEFCKYRNIGY